MNDTHILLVLLWILYGVLHSMLASLALKKWLYKKGSGYEKYYRLGYSVFAFASLVALLWFQFSITGIVLFVNGWLRFLPGIPLALVGLVIMIICSKNYLLHLLGVETFLKKDTAAILKTDGLHRFVRHPLYLGTFMFITGLFFCFPYLSNLIMVLVIILYTLIGIRLEEKKLLVEFGEAYSRYQGEVPTIIPSFFGLFKTSKSLQL